MEWLKKELDDAKANLKVRSQAIFVEMYEGEDVGLRVIFEE